MNTRVPDTESEEAHDDQPKARKTSRSRAPAPEKGATEAQIAVSGQPSSKSKAQPAVVSSAWAAVRRGEVAGRGELLLLV